jgi:uncharacterized SAM-binding protein YcdF (DUF218 family)
MFDSSLCDRPIPEHPFFIDWLRFEWLNKPLLIVLILLAFLGLGWVIYNTRWRRWFKSPKVIALLFVGTATLPLLVVFLAVKGLVVFLPPDPGTQTEAIVILGRGPLLERQRLDLAAELWQAKRAPLIFASGRGDADRMVEQLEKTGIPQRSLDGETCSLTTWENAIFTSAILQARGIRRILLITDSPHMLRSLLVYRANGFTVIPRTTGIPSFFYGKRGKAFLYLKEYPGLISYALRGLFHPQRSPQPDSPDLANLLRDAQQYGQLGIGTGER